MKTFHVLGAAAILFAAVACNSGKPAGNAEGADSTAVAAAAAAPAAEAATNLKDLLPTKGEVDSVSYLLGTQLGGLIKGYNFAKDLKELNFAQMKKGIVDYIKSKGNPRDPGFGDQFAVNPEETNRLFNGFLEKRKAYTAAANQEAEAKFLAANKAKEGVTETESGLQYIIEEPGNDVKPAGQDTVYVHYKLCKTDGEVIEEIPAEEPSVSLRLNQVIPGWTEGMQLFGEGGKGILYVPSALGYGENGQGGIEPNTTLVFNIQLDSVKRFIPKEEVAE